MQRSWCTVSLSDWVYLVNNYLQTGQKILCRVLKIHNAICIVYKKMIAIMTVLVTLSLFASVNIAHADVTDISLSSPLYELNEQFSFTGTESEGSKLVSVVLNDPNGDFIHIISARSDSDGSFTTSLLPVINYFRQSGVYSANAFSETQPSESGTLVSLQFDGYQIFAVPDFEIELVRISSQSAEVGKKLSFPVAIEDRDIDDIKYQLAGNVPGGATIDEDTGVFTWTPTSTQGTDQGVTYHFDVTASKTGLSDKTSIMITVKSQPRVSTPSTGTLSPSTNVQSTTTSISNQNPELQIPAPFVDLDVSPQSYVDRYQNEPAYKEWFDVAYPQYGSIYHAVGLDEPLLVPAPFVDPNTDPQSYVDRYQNEPAYKEWFDVSYPQYGSIYHAVGLDDPFVPLFDDTLLIPAPFVDTNTDPQSYVDRYQNDPAYKEWFDVSYPQYGSIYHAVGLDEPLLVPAPFVDPNTDPQSYVDRYQNEPAYKEWFDVSYPQYDSIYHAVNITDPAIIAAEEAAIIKAIEERKAAAEAEGFEFGECGTGTELVDGMCTLIEVESPNDKGGDCMIATAAYGSKLEPQVQTLREIRNDQLMTSDMGNSFITGFNHVYYAVSPHIADYEMENPIFKDAVRILITPMLATLSFMEHADSEYEILGYGTSIILLNIGMYLVAPILLIFMIARYAGSKGVIHSYWDSITKIPRNGSSRYSTTHNTWEVSN